MATAKISEYESLATDANGLTVPVPLEPAIATQTVTYTTNLASAAFNEKTRFIRVIADAKAHFVIALVPVADADDPYLVADVDGFFGVPKGQSYKIGVYDGTS